jgi:peptidoglycan hydrolase CwlO-like protein
MHINEEIQKLKLEISDHQVYASHHQFQAKVKQAKLNKLEKQLEKLNEIINEPIPGEVHKS